MKNQTNTVQLNETIRRYREDDLHADSPRICLNCGAEVVGNFCHHCGQPTDTGRFTGRTFTRHAFGALTRVSSNFFVTVWRLITCPWNVVRDYVYGRRVGLVAPLNLILLLSLYHSVIFAAFSWWGIDPGESSVLTDDGWYSSMLNYLYSSITLQYLILAFPLSVSTYIVYRKDIKGRFNFAELLIASLYLACSYLILGLIIMPVEMVSEMTTLLFVGGAVTVYGILSLTKAFPQRSLSATIAKLLFWLFLSFILSAWTIGLMAVPLVIGKI